MGNSCCKVFKKSKYRNNSSDNNINNNNKNNNNNNKNATSVKKTSTSNNYYSTRKSSINSLSNNRSCGNASSLAYVFDAASLNLSKNKKSSLNDSKHPLVDSGHSILLNSNNAHEEASVVVPHIGDFYPEEDNEAVPADNARISTLFLLKAKTSVAREVLEKRRYANENSFLFTDPHGSSDFHAQLPKKYNSCSTIYIDDSTVSQPNLKSAIRLVACAVYYHIKKRTSDRTMDIFDEKKYPLSKDMSVPENYDKQLPDQRYIYKFMKNLFNAAQLTAECAIVTLIYLERVLTYAEIDLGPSNWKRLLLGAILLASKVWDDQAVWNVDYCQILRDMNVDNINELEREYLKLLQFNINVPSSVYAKYYFDLRSLAEEYNLTFPHEPLTKEKALKLEAISSMCQERFKDYVELQQKMMRRTASADNLYSCQNHIPSRKSLVILS